MTRPRTESPASSPAQVVLANNSLSRVAPSVAISPANSAMAASTSVKY